MLVRLLISRIVLEDIKAISRSTKIDVGRQSVLMVCMKITAICFSLYLFKLLNKFIVMPHNRHRKNFIAQGKILAKPVIYCDSWHEKFD